MSICPRLFFILNFVGSINFDIMREDSMNKNYAVLLSNAIHSHDGWLEHQERVQGLRSGIDTQRCQRQYSYRKMSSKRSESMDETNVILQSNERHKIAKKKRLLQLKRFNQYEKQLEKSSYKKSTNATAAAAKKSNNLSAEARREVRFVGKVRLLEAAARNDVEEVRQLLEAGVSPDVTNNDGLTAMHQCCIDNFEEMLCLLIQYGANVNACDSELWTPLHAAAACGHLNLCKHLINNGSDLMAVNCDGMMAYDICDNEMTLDFIETEMTKKGITQQLIDETRNLRELDMLRDLKNLANQGHGLDWKGRNGESLLHVAACNGYMEVTQFLLSQPSVSIDAVDNELWQPVHCAVCWNQLGVLELLLIQGANLESRTRSGETPFDICEDEEMRHQISEMRDHWQRNKQTKSRDLVHRPSNVRSSSVRRSSMKQKKATSMKEALEEGKILTTSSIANANNNNLDDEAECNTPNYSNSKARSNSYTKDKNWSSVSRSSSNQPEANGSKLDPKDNQQLSPSTLLPNAGSGNSLNTERPKTYNLDDSQAEDDDITLHSNDRSQSYRSVDDRTADSFNSDNNNDNNNLIRVGTPLPSALKKPSQPLSPTATKSNGCCSIV